MALFSTHDNPAQLMDHRVQPHPLSEVRREDARHEIICHIEGSLLDSRLPAFLDIARIAVQRRYDAHFVPMALDTLRAAHEGIPGNDGSPVEDRALTPLHLVSSLSTALRGPVGAMIGRKGLLWTSDIYRAGGIASGGFTGRPAGSFAQRALYKTCAALHLMARSDAHFHMVGDGTDVDAYVFLGVFYWSSRVLSDEGFERYLRYSGIDPQSTRAVVRKYAGKHQSRVASILVHESERHPMMQVPPLTSPILTFRHYIEVAIRWADFGIIAPDALWTLARKAHNIDGVSPEALIELMQRWSPANPALNQRRDMILDQFRAIVSQTPLTTAAAPATAPQPLAPLAPQGRGPLDEATLLGMVETWLGQGKQRAT